MRPEQNLARRLDSQPDDKTGFARAVVNGLSQPHKTLPCRFFYDARGSELFEEITRLPEYYPTRTEIEILRANAGSIVGHIRAGDVLVEFGSGSSLKTEILLDCLPSGVTYVPVDVSPSALDDAARRLSERYPGLDIRPLVADFGEKIALPDDLLAKRKTGFFPGSTIGNLAPRDAEHLLRAFAAALGPDCRMIIGVDLKKDVRTLVAAYNDADGVTAAFNRNLLTRINRELSGNFNEQAFRHEAIYNPREGRIEMYLISTRDQTVDVQGTKFRFRANESIHTENSYKYTVLEFQDLAAAAGWRALRTWTDPASNFSVHELGQ